MHQKSPCLGCSHQFDDKNSPMCTNCPERIEYANTGTWTKRAPEPAPVKKKRGPGRPKGSGKKKIDAKAPLKEKPSTHSAWAKPKTENQKLDLSKFKKITISPHVHYDPMIKIAKDHAFSFNRACIDEFKIKEIVGVDVFVNGNGKGKQIVFAPAENPTFRINNSKKSQYGFSNKKLFLQLDVKPGSYPVKNVDGMMLITL